MDKIEKVKKLACKLCAESNGTGCTTPTPDPNHWICKAWLSRATKEIDQLYTKPDVCSECGGEGVFEFDVGNNDEFGGFHKEQEVCQVCKGTGLKPPEDKDKVLTREQMKIINDAQPSEAKYGDVFEAIAEAQRDLTASLYQAEFQAEKERAKRSRLATMAKAIRDNLR